MTFQQFQKSWWSWVLCAVVVVAIGFSRQWDTISLICAGGLALSGLFRLFSAPVRRFAVRQAARGLAHMTPEQRERELQRMSPDQKAEVLKEMGIAPPDAPSR